MIDSLRRAIYHTLKAAWYRAFGEPGFVTVTGADGGKYQIGIRVSKKASGEFEPVGFLRVTETLTPDEKERLRERFRQEFSQPGVTIEIPCKFVAGDNPGTTERDK